MDPYVLDTFIYKSSIRNAIFKSNKRHNKNKYWIKKWKKSH